MRLLQSLNLWPQLRNESSTLYSAWEKDGEAMLLARPFCEA